MKLTLKNFQFRLLFEIIDAPLHGAQARARNRVAKRFNFLAKELEDNRQKLLEKYAKKNKDGSLKKNASGSAYDMEDEEAFKKEYSKALEADVVMEITNGERDDFRSIKEVILNTQKMFDIAETETYETLCTAFEVIK